MRGKILMIKMTESIFVVSDLLWHDSFTSPFSELELFLVMKIPFHQAPPWLVSLLLVCFPVSMTLYHFWFRHRRAYRGMALIKPNSRCEICRLTLAQRCLTTSQHIFVQASFTGVCLVHFSVRRAWRGLKCRDSADRWSPAGGSGDSQVLPDWHCRLSWMLSRTLDVVFINYRLSRCSYYSRGGRRKYSFLKFSVALSCIFLLIVLTLFRTAEVCPIFEKCMNIDLLTSMFYL